MPRRAVLAAFLGLALMLSAGAEAQRAGGRGKQRARVTSNKARAPGKKAAAKKSRRHQPHRSRLRRIQRRPHPLKRRSKKQRREIKRFMRSAEKWVRDRAEVFRSVTERRDYTDHYVLHRDKDVTAFLDWSDPVHPLYDPRRETGEQHVLDKFPKDRRAHILVVPNRPREHVGKKLGGQIETGDVEATLKTMQAAEKLAGKLGIKNPEIFVNSEKKISVGYLHVHIIGERPADRPYPKALEP